MGKTNIKQIKKIRFKDITTLKVGGEIKYFKDVFSDKELIEVIKFAKTKKLPIFIIGEGSDIAASEKKFNGVVIRYRRNNISFDKNIVTAEAGASWDKLVEETVNKNLKGIENLSGIPGTVGAAPIQNIGAYGQEFADTFVSLRAYDIKEETFVKFSKANCKFDYRESIFKNEKFWQRFVITDVTIKLTKYTNKNLPLRNIREEILRTRKEKLVDPKMVPNAGSFFKNPIILLAKKKELEKKYPEVKIYPFNSKYKVSGGWLIEKAGWKGRSLGKVAVSPKHALVLTNPEGKGNFSDIKVLADAIIYDVYKKFKIRLEPEVQYINY